MNQMGLASPEVGWLVLFGVAGLVALVDTFSKRWARRRFCGRRVRFGVALDLQENRRTPSGPSWLLILLWLCGAAASLFLYRLLVVSYPLLFAASLGAAVGGSGANLVEILHHRRVTDFLDLGLGGVFNLADVGIYLGVLGALGATGATGFAFFEAWLNSP